MGLNLRVLFAVLAVATMVAIPQAASALEFQESPGGPIQSVIPDNDVRGLATADLDGNGNDDIIAVGAGVGIFVYLADNDGQGFTPAVGSPFGTSSPTANGRFEVYAGNFGGDSAIDLLVGTNVFPNSFETYLGDGTGAFPAAPDFTIPIPNLLQAVGSAQSAPLQDLNDDGWPDLLVGMSDHKFRVALGSSTGQFSWTAGSPVNVPTPTNSTNEYFLAATAGDWNGDGDQDVALAGVDITVNEQIAIYTANGDGTGAFTPAASAVRTQPPGQTIENLATIDLNGDQYDDLSFSTKNPDQFRTMIGSPTGLVENPAQNSFIGTGTNSSPGQMAVADFTGEGADDLGGAIWSLGQFAIARNEGDGNIASVTNSPFTFPAIGGAQFRPNVVSNGDFNGDGAQDLVSASHYPDLDSNIARGIEVLINQPVPVVTPTSLDFPVTAINSSSAPLTVEVKNDGGADLYINSINKVGGEAGQFDVDSTDCPSILPAGSECDVEVTYEPDGEFKVAGANLIVSFIGGFETVVVSMDGQTPAKMEPDSETLEFGEVIVGYEPDEGVEYIQIDSTGGVPLTLGTPVITGPDASDFSVENAANCTAAPIPSGDSCTLQVNFAPSSGGFREGYLGFQSTNDPDPPDPIALEGYGRRAEYSVSPASHDFGEAKISEATARPSQTFTVDSTGAGGVPFDGASITGADDDAFEISFNNCPTQEPIAPYDGSCSITVEFNPTSGEAGARSANLVIDAFSSIVPGPTTIPLTGTATKDPVPPPVGKPKLTLKLKSAAKVKRGKTLVVTAVVKNIGDGAAKPLSIKATVPAKLAKSPKAIKVSTLAPGKSVTRKLKIKVKRSAKKGKKLKVKVTTASGTVKKAATRTVKVR